MAGRREDHTLAVGEALTRRKAEAVLARYGDAVRDAADGLVQQFLAEDPRRDVTVSVCSVEQLLHHCPRRGKGVESTCLGVVYFMGSSGYHRTATIHVRWDTAEIFVLG